MMTTPPDSFNPFDDTSPNITIHMEADELPVWRQALGWISLLGALTLTLGTLILVLLPMPSPIATEPTLPATSVSAVATTPALPAPSATVPPVLGSVSTDSVLSNNDRVPQAYPTLNAERLATLLQTPIMIQGDDTRQRAIYDPYTIIPARPRTEFTTYTVQSGDTVDAIAQRYNISADSIAWCNDRRIIFVLRPGDTLRIPPVDGACHQILGTQNLTIAQLAERYQISDPFELIDSPYTNLFGRTPDDVLPGGITLFLPGGQGEVISWNPGYEEERDASGNVAFVTFASGQDGSCGRVPASGGSAWGNPLPNGTWTRGFFVGHTGIDLAAPTGTPIYAANSGPVLFSGFSRWGYGEAVVLGHGRFSTLYGHMSQRNVSCGQSVSVGQVVGLVGSTGQSTGPHLHFEIRYDDQPQNPSGTPGIGW